MQSDTITAISTPVGEGAIGIVRLSGPEALSLSSKVFQGPNLMDVDTHTIHYGKIVDPETDFIVDEVMVTVMHAPKTFTMEDVVEINCHGGIVAVNRILKLILKIGARLAEPGEFTKRAFLNGRIDLSQAEAVIDLIRSKTDQAMNIAVDQLEGRLSTLIQSLRQKLIETIAHVEVNIDYPEYDDVEQMSHDLMKEKSKEVYQELERLLQIADQGKILREGIKTAIVGRPNVGKSSLMNKLIQEEKAIVTDIPGTTRDVIEEYVNVRGIPLKLVDTAGIRETDDIVERIGVERSQRILKEADLILFMLNYNEQIKEDDLTILDTIKDENFITIINKADLDHKLQIDHLPDYVRDKPLIEMSIIEDKGIDEIESILVELFFEGKMISDDLTYVSNARHIQLLQQAKQSLEDAINALEMNIPLDIVQIDVTRTWEFLGEIIGDTASEGLVNQLFSQFCLGK